MFAQTLAIIRNTFLESIRQPIMLVLLLVATLALIFSNALAAYSMEDDQRMMIDMGLSTVFLCGTLIAAFIATNVLGREIENKTALTVISKPVGRPVFVIGKLIGVSAALALATLYMSFLFLLVEMHGTMQTARTPYHMPVILFSIGAAMLGLGAAVWCNYFYNRVFSSAAIIFTTPLMGIAYLLAMMFDPQFKTQPMSLTFDSNLWLALAGLLVAILILTGIAVAASTRAGQVMTLIITLGVFLLGMMSDHFFGRPIERLHQTWLQRAHAADVAEMQTVTRIVAKTTGEENEIQERELVSDEPIIEFATTGERAQYAGWWVARAAVPNFQVFWLADAVTQENVIPTRYIVLSSIYGILYMGAATSLGIVLFQQREVG